MSFIQTLLRSPLISQWPSFSSPSTFNSESNSSSPISTEAAPRPSACLALRLSPDLPQVLLGSGSLLASVQGGILYSGKEGQGWQGLASGDFGVKQKALWSLIWKGKSSALRAS